ncbi:MAG TPA: hypothetical protein VH350_11315 [Candidatus Sulfotelmatobacter sp.]|nr:hypothetical protein [Candidatus Sulfotelmatobacter sp.]
MYKRNQVPTMNARQIEVVVAIFVKSPTQKSRNKSPVVFDRSRSKPSLVFEMFSKLVREHVNLCFLPDLRHDDGTLCGE